MTNTMNCTEEGYNLIKKFEQCRLEAYLDQGGVTTIGWGHTRNVKIGDKCSQEQADVWLKSDVAWAVTAINSEVKVPLQQNQLNALTCFVYNVGVGAFKNSTCLRMLNNEYYQEAADFMLLFNKVKGVVAPGLTRRREAERAMFLGLA